ncbi:hypothetical protein [Sphingomicrobium astaxanthinifaciens]|uniref:hypothetical protein n=1 Tax=Sphingomicrobium astaxanthinifaciens TaxID=1227949 RepID=UPI001FCBA2DC|nr:hypothetical protein [Sphingomicrobium astaxanthinifaciens]MCJ7421229.1 hypothetical protein [Sphingomicrobium astaxanthinifaciens]
MSKPIKDAELLAAAKVVEAPRLPNIRAHLEDRNFELPVALHAGVFGLFLVYLGVMGLGFSHPEMVIPIAICLLFTAAFYIVPMAWAVMNPAQADKAMPLQALFDKGIAIHTGHSRGGDAATQVLILPVLILGWGIAVVSIAALA